MIGRLRVNEEKWKVQVDDGTCGAKAEKDADGRYLQGPRQEHVESDLRRRSFQDGEESKTRIRETIRVAEKETCSTSRKEQGAESRRASCEHRPEEVRQKEDGKVERRWTKARGSSPKVTRSLGAAQHAGGMTRRQEESTDACQPASDL